jgi:hypothetical protein
VADDNKVSRLTAQGPIKFIIKSFFISRNLIKVELSLNSFATEICIVRP